MKSFKDIRNLSEESPIALLGKKLGKAAYRKEYEAAIEMMLGGKKAADAARIFKHVDARELQKMFDALNESTYELEEEHLNELSKDLLNRYKKAARSDERKAGEQDMTWAYQNDFTGKTDHMDDWSDEDRESTIAGRRRAKKRGKGLAIAQAKTAKNGKNLGSGKMRGYKAKVRANESVEIDEGFKKGDSVTYLNDKGKKVTGIVAKRSTNSPKGYFLDTGEFVSQQRVIESVEVEEGLVNKARAWNYDRLARRSFDKSQKDTNLYTNEPEDGKEDEVVKNRKKYNARSTKAKNLHKEEVKESRSSTLADLDVEEGDKIKFYASKANPRQEATVVGFGKNGKVDVKVKGSNQIVSLSWTHEAVFAESVEIEESRMGSRYKAVYDNMTMNGQKAAEMYRRGDRKKGDEFKAEELRLKKKLESMSKNEEVELDEASARERGVSGKTSRYDRYRDRMKAGANKLDRDLARKRGEGKQLELKFEEFMKKIKEQL